MDSLEERITELLQTFEEIEILESFIKSDFYFYTGKIRIKYLDITLDFDVNIPYNYPLTLPNADNISIIFKNTDLIGISHINNDGSVCFHPDKDDNFECKFKSEISGLKKWIKDYYLLNKEDDNYTYLIHNTSGEKQSNLIFSNNEKKFKKDDFGVFAYSCFSNNQLHNVYDDKKTDTLQTFYRIGFDKENEDKWSSNFSSLLKKNPNKGLWVYIESEPLIEDGIRRKGIKTWSQLQNYLPKEFIKYLYDNFKKLNKFFFFENELFISIGYKIPNKDSYEIHWDLIKIPKKALPIDSVFVPVNERDESNQKYIGVCNDTLISWGMTTNANYDRFFGRGKLTSKLTNSRILLIGCGAMGSSLAETLVRGGCKSIFIEDFDSVQTGNICRAKYDLQDVDLRKVLALKNKLQNISPYINITSIPVKANVFSEMEKQFNQTFDYIFDCSTDTEITYLLDNINFKGKIFSLSITNKAKNLVCVSGENITKHTKNLYDFTGNESPSYYEGAGCGYPTFEANFNEINTLLNIAIDNINSQINNDVILDNFIISRNYSMGLNQFVIDSFYYYKEPISNSELYFSFNAELTVKEELKKYYPNEFGGVFIGFKNENVIFISDVLIPDKFEIGKTIFVRHPGSLNDQLVSIFEKSNGKIIYIGEWHSHPDSPAKPSTTDNIAIAEIAANKTINNDSPIMMIAEVSERNFHPEFYIYKNKKLYNYE